MHASLPFPALVTVLTITGSGCSHHEELHESAPTPVRVHVVGLAAAGSGVRYSATINPYEQVELGFKVSGYIREIVQVRGADGRMRAVEQGDLVRRGTVLARVRESDYVERVNRVKAELTRAEVSVQKAQQDWQRARHLFSTRSLTKPDYDSAKAQLESAQASVVAVRAQLQEAQLTLQDCSLSAPLEGVVIQRRLEVGSLAAPEWQCT
jgi:RND family efflux transporter MFP subunit